jgi:rare lipoprotein A
MRRIVIALLALMAFSGFAEAHSRYHYHHHHHRYGFSHHPHRLHFQGRHYHHHRYGYRMQRQALARQAPSTQPSFGGSSVAGQLVRASWYGGGEKLSSRTASGEHFNRGGLTAAHRSLPFGTRVQVTNVATGRAVVVRINDRGPFVGGRSLDLARGAAQAIGLHSTGSVRMVVLN